MGLLPIILIIFFGLWQIALTGFTYVLAGHAAREGARELARRLRATRARRCQAATARPRARTSRAAGASSAEIEKRGEVTVSVRLKVPVLIPGFKSPLTVGTTADTVRRGRRLPDRQDETPTSELGEDGNWN